MTPEERKSAYANSALRVLMESSGHEICERCYCCDVVSESAPCWSCGGLADFEDGDGWPDVCQDCGGEGYQYWKECIGRCDELGIHHETKVGE